MMMSLKVLLFAMVLLIPLLTADGSAFHSGLWHRDATEMKSDSILSSYDLDTIRFVMTSKEGVQKLHSDTIEIEVEGEYYKVPYRVVIEGVKLKDNSSKWFDIRSLSLREHKDFRNYLQNLFNNPREKLREPISPQDWRSSSIYDRYFRPYDGNRDQQQNKGDGFSELLGSDSDKGVVVEDQIDFPLPETVDLEVNLNETPRTLTVLEIEYNFDKLDPEFQRIILNFRDQKGKSGNRNVYD